MKAYLKSTSLFNSEAINPYSNTASSILECSRKIKWDISNNGRRSRKALTKFRKIFNGEKAVIVCNGPSLLHEDLSLLKNTFSIGLNKINLLFEKDSYRPNLIVAVNKHVIEQNREFYSSTKIPLCLSRLPAQDNNLNASERRALLFTSSSHPGFSCDPRYAVSEGSTVTYVAMQLAYYLGFKKVALIGCDHNFVTKGPDHLTVTAYGDDKNHFDPRYFSAGVKWQLPSISETEDSYRLAKVFYEKDNRLIYNCTIGGKLEIFRRMPLRQFLQTE